MRNTLPSNILSFESLIDLKGPFLKNIYESLNTKAYNGGYVLDKDKIDDSINAMLDKAQGWSTSFLTSFQFLSSIVAYLYSVNSKEHNDETFNIFDKRNVKEINYDFSDYKVMLEKMTLDLFNGNKFAILGGKLYIPLKYDSGAQLYNILKIDPIAGERTVIRIGQFLNKLTITNINELHIFNMEGVSTKSNKTQPSGPLPPTKPMLRFPSVEELTQIRAIEIEA